MKRTLFIVALLAALPAVSIAGTYSAVASGAPGSTITLNVAFAGDGNTVETQTDLDYSNTRIALTGGTAIVAGSLCQVISPTKVRVTPPSGGVVPLTSTATAYCSFQVAITAGADAVVPFTAQPGDVLCFNAAAGNETCTLAANSAVTIQSTPVPRTLVFNPTAGSTITLAGGTLSAGGTSATTNIAVTAAGTSGTPTVSGCAITGAGASSFTVTPTSLSFPASGSQNLGVSCVYSAVATTATLTCNETDGDSTNTPRAFPLSCPAQAVVPVNPTITAVPASGATISLAGGIAGTQAIGVVDFSATGGAGTGSTAISCISTGNVQIANSPATPSGQGPVNQTVTGANQPIDLRVGVTLTTVAQAPAGTVTCTAAGQAPFTYTVNAPAGTTVVPPTFIPSSSTWSMLALLSLMGVFGLLAVGFRRQS